MSNGNEEPRSGRDAVAYGVEELIERLREDGVAKGREEAEKIVADAEARARWLVSQAQDEADTLVGKARDEAKALKRSADDALQVAARDMLLSLRERLTHRFAGEVRRLVGERMNEAEFLQQLVLEVAGRQAEVIDSAEQVEVVLPRRALEVGELRRDPAQLKEGELTRFVLGITDDMLRDGITLRVDEEDLEGIKARLVNEEIEVEVSAEAVTALLLEHLQPRFRALLEGIVRG